MHVHMRKADSLPPQNITGYISAKIFPGIGLDSYIPGNIFEGGKSSDSVKRKPSWCERLTSYKGAYPLTGVLTLIT